MATIRFHEPVLLKESLALLALGPGGLVVDGTVGGGGHAEAILEATAPDGRLVGLDVDAEALREASSRLQRFEGRVELIQHSFRRIGELHASHGAADAILFDLGVSSHQLDRGERGFRFSERDPGATPLDMRMDRDSGRTAAELLQTSPFETLEDWFRRYGEIPGARRLARAVVEARRQAPLRTAADLVAVVHRAGIGRGRRHHPATLVFQALRIAVNDELKALEEGLSGALSCLAPGGRLVVIAYHSLEDRIVKGFLRREARDCICPPELPVCTCTHHRQLRILTRKPVRPGELECQHNPRGRSARLRTAERLAEAT